jgi:hypothetical protein
LAKTAANHLGRYRLAPPACSGFSVPQACVIGLMSMHAGRKQHGSSSKKETVGAEMPRSSVHDR